MILYHISTDVKKDGHFTPRIPRHTMGNENREQLRVCAAPSIQACFTGLPGGGHQLVNLNAQQDGFFKLFRINTEKLGISDEDILTPVQLTEHGWVPDAKYTLEHWISVPFTVAEEDSFVIILNRWSQREVEMLPACEQEESMDLFPVIIDVIDSISIRADAFKKNDIITHYSFFKAEAEFLRIIRSVKKESGATLEMVDDCTMQVKEGEVTVEQLARCTLGQEGTCSSVNLSHENNVLL